MTEEQLKNIKTWAHWARLELARNKKKTPQVFTPEYYDDESAFVETVEGLLSENEKLREENKTLRELLRGARAVIDDMIDNDDAACWREKRSKSIERIDAALESQQPKETK